MNEGVSLVRRTSTVMQFDNYAGHARRIENPLPSGRRSMQWLSKETRKIAFAGPWATSSFPVLV